jgi:hypothetical protein
MNSTSPRQAIIHNRVFWWLYPDGRKERIYANERIRAHLSQVASVEARMAKEEAPKGRTNHPPRPPGTAPTLPAIGHPHDSLTLGELAHMYGWGSVYRFSEALRKHRRPIYEQARANGNAKSAANLTPPVAPKSLTCHNTHPNKGNDNAA